MTLDEKKQRAYEVIAHAEERNASYEHPESKKQAELAGIIIGLCSEIEALQAQLATKRDAHLGAVGE